MSPGRWRVALVLWMGLIFVASSGLLSVEMSSEGTERWLGGLNYVARKTAHVGEYAVLAYLWLRSLWTAGDRFGACMTWSVVLSVVYAVSDECHQALVPQRDGVWTDVVWDAAGAVAAALVLSWVHSRGAPPVQRRLFGRSLSGSDAKRMPSAG